MNKQINLSATLEKVRAACHAYNVDKELKQSLRDNHVHTAVWIYRLYVDKQNESDRDLKFKFVDSTSALAGCLRVDVKTIKNRLKRLQLGRIAWQDRLDANKNKCEYMVSPELLVFEEVEAKPQATTHQPV